MTILPKLASLNNPFRYLSRLLTCYLIRREGLKALKVNPDITGYSKFLVMGWELESGPAALPTKFLENRVHGATRLSLGRYCHPPDCDLMDTGCVDEVNQRFDDHLGRGFLHAGEAFQALSSECKVIMRHVKTGDEDPWWPTSRPDGSDGIPGWDGNLTGNGQNWQVGEFVDCPCFAKLPPKYKGSHPGEDLISQMVDEAHAHGMLFMAYYRHMAECRLGKNTGKGWLCRSIPNGNPLADYYIPEANGGYHLNIADDEYRAIVLQRLLELAERGVDGFNFDSIHMPLNEAWNETLHEEFVRLSGLTEQLEKHWENEVFRRYLDFIAYKVEETFSYWKREVKLVYPNVVFAISTTFIPSLINRRMTTNLARIADVPKNEYTLALSNDFLYPMSNCADEQVGVSCRAAEEDDVIDENVLHYLEPYFRNHGLRKPPDDIRMAAGWTILRDAAGGRPPRIWAPNFADISHTRAFAASLLAYGVIVNLNVNEDVLNDALQGSGYPDRFPATPAAALQEAFRLGARLSPVLKNTRPIRWAVIHFSELARNYRDISLDNAWKEVLLPFLGAFEIFVRRGIPLGVVTDYQLEHGQLEGVRLVFLTNPTELTANQVDNLQTFIRRGGFVIANHPGWDWNSTGFDAETHPLGAKVDDLMQCYPPPVQLIGGTGTLHAVAHRSFKDKRIVVAVTNDFSFVQPRKKPPRMGSSKYAPPPNPINDAEIYVFQKPGPLRCTEVALSNSGTSLAIETMPSYARIKLPKFQELAMAEIEFA